MDIAVVEKLNTKLLKNMGYLEDLEKQIDNPINFLNTKKTSK